MAVAQDSSRLAELVRRLDAAVAADGDSACCMNVKRVLEEAVQSGQEFLEARFLQPIEGRYARRLVHKDPGGAYTLLAMVWGVGQGTPVHDHAGHWCCECVYKGRIKVVQFDLKTPVEAEVLLFEPQGTIYAGVGEAGALIPPYEYHSIENPDDQPAVTLHVYKGELTWCHSFEPVEGGYRKMRKELYYTD